jgi:ferritin
MPSAVAAELQRQLNHEVGAAYAYEALSLWCEDRSLKGFATFFWKQAGEEREHARKMMDHLLDRGVVPELRAVGAPRAEFASLLDAAKHAQSMEQANTSGIHQAYEVSLREKDYASQPLLRWFIDEQVEEEAWTDEMVDRVTAANCAGGLLDLDRHIERLLEQKVVAEHD